MRTRLLLALAAGLYAATVTGCLAAATLTIQVDNVRATEGTLRLQIMAGEAEFTGDEPATASIMQRARAGSMTFTASGLPDGDYAVRVMHDVNDNGKLDSNFVGAPKEPWAMSNNAVGNLGPPSWQAVRFALSGDVTQQLTLR